MVDKTENEHTYRTHVAGDEREPCLRMLNNKYLRIKINHIFILNAIHDRVRIRLQLVLSGIRKGELNVISQHLSEI